MIEKYGKGRRIISIAIIILIITFYNNIALGEEVELLSGVLPSSYKIYGGQPSYATDRNTSTSINLNNGGLYWVEYTIPLGTTVTAYEVVGSYRGIIKFLDEERNILWQKEFYYSMSKTSINVKNVRYVYVTSGERAGGNYFYLKELYIWGIVPTPPSPPQNLEAIALSPNRVKLTWGANSDSDLAGYVIYRNGEEIARVNNDVTYYIDNSVSPGNTYTYSIKAYDTEGFYSDFSDSVEITTPLLPDLKAPTDLRLQILSPTVVKLKWEPVSDVDGYILYKNGNEIAKLDNAETEFLDVVDPGKLNYGIQSYSIIEGSKYFSDIVEHEIEIPDPTPKLYYSLYFNEVRLRWDGYAGLYKVFVNGEEIATVTDKKYTFTGAEEKTYTVKVMAIYSYDNTTYISSEVKIYIPKISKNTKMAMDIIKNIGNAVYPMGSLLAIGLALKATPFVINVIKVLGRRI